jgi:hypothetical protein
VAQGWCLFFGKKPNIERLEEFGQKCWIKVPDQQRTKLELKSEQHIFTGVAANSKAWRYLNTHSNHIQTSRNMIFDNTDNTLIQLQKPMTTMIHRFLNLCRCNLLYKVLPPHWLLLLTRQNPIVVTGLLLSLSLITTACWWW